MKLTKISLAAVVALGALSTSGFAGDLSEAIKGVDFSGAMRYRFNGEGIENKSGKKDDDESAANHQWRAMMTFKTPVAENFQGVVSTRYDSRTDTGVAKNPKLGMTDVDSKDYSKGATANSSLTEVREVYGVWTPAGSKTSVMVGKQALATPVTDKDDDRGTGILALSKDVKGVTLAAGAFDTWYVDQLANSPLATVDGVRKPLYVLAAITDTFSGFSAQAWYFNITDIVDGLFFFQADYKYDMFMLKGQYAYNELANGSDAVLAAYRDKNSVYSLSAGVNFKPVTAWAGYIGTASKAYMVSLDDEAAYKLVGERWHNFSNGGLAKDGAKNELSAWYIKAMADVGYDIGIGIDYVSATFTTNTGAAGAKDADKDVTEIVPRVTWKATKKLDLASYYSYLTSDYNTAGTEDEVKTRLRLQAVYKF